MSVPAGVAMQDDGGLRRIAALCDGEVSFRTDSSRELVYMEGLHFMVNGREHKMDALLCLNYPNPTYPTKLYLSQQVGAGLNWNETAYLLSRNWYTFSWKDVPANRPLLEILAAHLAALNPPV